MIEAGVFLGAAYMLTRRLWLPIGIHAGWNFTQGGLFGVPVSGLTSHGLLDASLSGPVWLSGGEFLAPNPRWWRSSSAARSASPCCCARPGARGHMASDPRVLFAAERTLLAWQRSSIALMGFGFVIERFSLFLSVLRHTPAGSLGGIPVRDHGRRAADPAGRRGGADFEFQLPAVRQQPVAGRYSAGISAAVWLPDQPGGRGHRLALAAYLLLSTSPG